MALKHDKYITYLMHFCRLQYRNCKMVTIHNQEPADRDIGDWESLLTQKSMIEYDHYP